MFSNNLPQHKKTKANESNEANSQLYDVNTTITNNRNFVAEYEPNELLKIMSSTELDVLTTKVDQKTKAFSNQENYEVH